MKDYKLSEIKEICEKNNDKSCPLYEVCNIITHKYACDWEIDKEETEE